MKEFLNLEELLEPESYEILKLLVHAAFLDPVTDVREAAIAALRTRYNGIFQKGYISENRMMLELKTDHSQNVYVCDVPSEYLYQPAKPVEFEIEIVCGIN